VFDASFKVDPVPVMSARVASGLLESVISRDCQVRPEQTRAWAQQLALRDGQVATDEVPGEARVPSTGEEVQRLRFENGRLQQELAVLKEGLGRLREGVTLSEKSLIVAARHCERSMALMPARPPLRAPTRDGPAAPFGSHPTPEGLAFSPSNTSCLKPASEQIRCTLHRVNSKAGLVARSPKKRRITTTDANHAEPIAPNLLARRFAVRAEIDRVWVSDMTYLPTREGTLYLATVLDLGLRRCVGWAMQDTMTSRSRCGRYGWRLPRVVPAPGLIHHSDRGSQYVAKAYRAELAKHALVASMSGTGNCYDNAVAESCFSTLEVELLMQSDWHTRNEAQRAVFRYIATWYNRKMLGYVSPAEFDAQLQRAA